jgi:propionyl-CoA synthetase
VAECAVIGVGDALKGQLPLGLVVLKAGVTRPYGEVRQELIDRVRQHIGPVAAFRHVAVVTRLPKTRSGKVLRATMRAIADSQSYTTPATIDDPRALEEIAGVLRTLGYAAPAATDGAR